MNLNCPICSTPFPLLQYLEHTQKCVVAANNAPNNDSSSSQPVSVVHPMSKEEIGGSTLINPIPADVPIGDISTGPPMNGTENQAVEKRPMPSDDNLLDQNNKRSRLTEESGQRMDDGGGTPQTQQVLNLQNPAQMPRSDSACPVQQIASDQSQENQRPQSAPFASQPLPQSHTINTSAVLNKSSPQVSLKTSSGLASELTIPQPQRAQEPVQGSMTAQSTQQPEGIESSVVGANAYQPQHATMSSQVTALPSHQGTPVVQQNPGAFGKRIKDEPMENGVDAVATGTGSANNKEMANIVVQQLLPYIRRLDSDIGQVRRRVEMFEASMSLKLANIEAAIAELKD